MYQDKLGCRRGVLVLLLFLGLFSIVFGGPLLAGDRGETKEAAEPAAAAGGVDPWGEEIGLDRLVMRFGMVRDGSFKSFEVFGDGTVIRDRREQFAIGPDIVDALLKLYEEHDFQAMGDMYGEGRRFIRVRASLDTETFSKEVFRKKDGQGPEPLTALVTGLIASIPEPAEVVTAADLADGLGKVLSGELSPRTMEMSLMYRSNPTGAVTDRAGWIFRVGGGRVEAELMGVGADLAIRGPFVEWNATEAILALVEQALSDEVATLPVNVVATGLTQLSLAVLDHEIDLQARAFSRKDPETDSDERGRLESFREKVELRKNELVPGARETSEEDAPKPVDPLP